ncbi:MAG: hypothetical protein ACI9WU_002091 [Myxococcota bacterium]|jgi:hypothetical protein
MKTRFTRTVFLSLAVGVFSLSGCGADDLGANGDSTGSDATAGDSGGTGDTGVGVSGAGGGDTGTTDTGTTDGGTVDGGSSDTGGTTNNNARWEQPGDTVALTMFADDRANQTYADGQIQWTGSFAWDAESNTSEFISSWLPGDRVWPTLWDDGPISEGGHEAEGQVAGDSIFSTEIFFRSPEGNTIEYGLLNEFASWIWVGTNGTLDVAAGATGRVDAGGVAFPKFGDREVRLELELAGLHADFATIAPDAFDIYVKGTMNSWTAVQILDNGKKGDAAADDGIFTYLHSTKLGLHDGLAAPGQHVQFVFVFALKGFSADEGLEYKSGADAVADGVRAWTGLVDGTETVEEAVVLEPDSKGKALNTTIVVSGDVIVDPPEPDCSEAKPCAEGLECLNGTCHDPGDPDAAPQVSLIDPAQGPASGGQPVVVSGVGFADGATVTFDGAQATEVVVVSIGTIECMTPAGAIGPADVVVTNPGGKSGSYDGGYTYNDKAAPTLDTVSPVSGATDGGTVVTITGTGFQAGASVVFGVNEAGGASVSNAGQTITCTSPSGDEGTADVTVTNPDGQSVTSVGVFTYEQGLVNFAILDGPASLTSVVGQAPAPVFARVYHPGVTESEGAPADLLVDLGWGSAGSDPTTDWTWSAATWAGQGGDFGNDDSFQATLPSDLAEGSYAFTFRVSFDGDQWLYADTSGSPDFDAADVGSLTVVTSPDGLPPVLDGVIGADWPAEAQVATDMTADAWDNNGLSSLWVTWDATAMYIGVMGDVEPANVLVGYIDLDYGDGTGALPSVITDSDGALDSALGGPGVVVTDADFGAELAFGAFGSAGTVGALSQASGFRGLADPTNLGWLMGDVVQGLGAVEFSATWAALGVDAPAAGELGIFVRIVSDTGDFAAPYGLPTPDGSAQTDTVVNL